ncbi:MAG TPA: nicotinate-nicotinamide nucleotide adenylyltransferase [Candidatus Saccharimonadales bacterium]|jgi:nicotinate-nucleotide adenylyltransferase
MTDAIRLGIYAGAFDPVHAGHVAFALQSLDAGRLDDIIFLPERRPRAKPGVEHYAHRVAMLRQALQPHPRLAVIEMVDRNYTVTRTMPQLQTLFPKATLVYLLGSDAALTVPHWPHAAQLLRSGELLVGVRSEHQHHEVEAAIDSWAVQPRHLTIVDSYAPDISSARIRQALRAGEYAKGLLSSVSRYARREWLYVSPAHITVR